jgi:LysR family transcriptional regulator of gallate degradation
MTDPSPDITQQLPNLRIFLSVAETKSITRSGEALYKAPSAITRSIIELERALQAPLFERKPRGMRLNVYGHAALVRAQRIHDEVLAATEEMLGSTPKSPTTSLSAVSGLLYSGRKLQLLTHLAAYRNISSAAAHMNMTQAGASMALARIESALGQPLFRRRMEGMIPTEVAERLVMRARRVFAELRHLSSDISAISGNLTGSVVIGSTPLGRTHVLPTAIATAISHQPNLRVSTVESRYEELIVSLRSGDIDMVFGVLRPPDMNVGLITEPLFTDRLCIVVRAGHRLASRKNLKLADLIHEKWIIPRPLAQRRTLVDTFFEAEGMEMTPTPSVETGDLAIIRQLLYASDMLAVTSPHQLEYEIQSRSIVELPVVLKGATREVGLIIREGAMLPPAALALLDTIRLQLQSH